MRRRRRFGGRRKRLTQWVGSTFGYSNSTSTLAVGGGPVGIELVGATGVAAAFDPPQIQRFTVEAVRGDIFAQFDPTGTIAGDFFVVGVGIIVCSTDNTGAAVLPDPVNVADAGSPWMWLKHYKYFSFGAGVSGDANVYQLVTGGEVWAKSKRVLRENQKLMLIGSATRSKGITTPLLYLQSWLRCLISRVA